MASIHEILRPITLTLTISQVAASTSRLLMYMGMQYGGPNETYVGHGREGSFHVYDHVRKIAQGRAPGAPAGRTRRNPIARVPFVYPRMHEQLDLLAEELHNLAKIDDPRMRDEAGANYIKMQTKTLSEKAANWRTALCVGMLRDSLYLVEDGDTWYPSYTDPGGAMRINYQMPAGNKSQLNMTDKGGTSVYGANIIDVSWANPAANIPLHIGKIAAAMQQQSGGVLTDILITFQIWQYIMTNDYVISAAGTSQTPFLTFEREIGKGPDGKPILEYIAKVAACPGITFHITDEGLEVGAPGEETYSKHVGANEAIFMQSPNVPELFKMYKGSEPIAEKDGGPKAVKVGFAAWSFEAANPTATQIFILDNALPVNHLFNAVAYGTVVF